MRGSISVTIARLASPRNLRVLSADVLSPEVWRLVRTARLDIQILLLRLSVCLPPDSLLPLSVFPV